MMAKMMYLFSFIAISFQISLYSIPYAPCTVPSAGQGPFQEPEEGEKEDEGNLARFIPGHKQQPVTRIIVFSLKSSADRSPYLVITNGGKPHLQFIPRLSRPEAPIRLFPIQKILF